MVFRALSTRSQKLRKACGKPRGYMLGIVQNTLSSRVERNGAMGEYSRGTRCDGRSAILSDGRALVATRLMWTCLSPSQ